jgi:hypothetical protein
VTCHGFFRFEAKHELVLARRRFLRRLACNVLAGLVLIGVSLFGEMAGYHWFEEMSCIDAFANVSMILSGMGPLGPLQTTAGKLFAGLYALYSGLMLIFITGIILAPIVHRVLHRFDVESEQRC